MLFVSHNMQSIRSLCTAAVQLDAGHVRNAGNVEDVVTGYLSQQSDSVASVAWATGDGPGDDVARLVAVEVLDSAGAATGMVWTGEPSYIRMVVDLARDDPAMCIGFDLATTDGVVVFRSYQTDTAEDAWPKLHTGRNTLRCRIPPWVLNSGRYVVMPRISLHFIRWIVHSDGVVSFEVHRDAGLSPYMTSERPGAIAPILEWELESVVNVS